MARRARIRRVLYSRIRLTAALGCLWLTAITLPDHAYSNIRTVQSMLASIVNRYTEAVDRRLPNEVLSTIHSQSPMLTTAIRQIRELFPLYDIEVMNQDFTHLGFDGTDQVATVTFSYRKRSGPFYRDNLTKAVFVFRQEDGTWKIWAMLPIDVKPLP